MNSLAHSNILGKFTVCGGLINVSSKALLKVNNTEKKTAHAHKMSQCSPITFLDILSFTLRGRKTESSRRNVYDRKKGFSFPEEGGPGRGWTAQIIGIKRLSFCIYHKLIQVSQPVIVCFLFLTANLLSHTRLWEPERPEQRTMRRE